LEVPRPFCPPIGDQPPVIIGVSGERGRDETIFPARTVLRTALALPVRDR